MKWKEMEMKRKHKITSFFLRHKYIINLLKQQNDKILIDWMNKIWKQSASVKL